MASASSGSRWHVRGQASLAGAESAPQHRHQRVHLAGPRSHDISAFYGLTGEHRAQDVSAAQSEGAAPLRRTTLQGSEGRLQTPLGSAGVLMEGGKMIENNGAGGGNRCRWREPKPCAANRMSVPARTSERSERVKCRGRESNPHDPCGSQDFKSCASASFATPANLTLEVIG